MKKDKEVKKEKGNSEEKNKPEEKENLGKYLLLGILVAAIILIVSLLSNREKSITADNKDKKSHIWSPESDSEFVKLCYDKYRSQVKDDLQKQENAKTYCRCMLEKMKTKYAEDEVNKMTDKEIKLWDIECRDQISNPEGLQ